MLKKKNKDELKYTNSAWDFELDPVFFYAYWSKAFSDEECDTIIKVANKKGLITATVGTGPEVRENDVRESKICWLTPHDNLVWVFQRLTNIILDLNKRYFKFDVFGMHEGLQFTNYKAPSGRYGKHIDRSDGVPVRKLSVTVQLTDGDKYEGGDLCLYGDDTPKCMDRTRGSLSIFPSYTLHEVTPVTKGERNSLVTWVTGKPFK
jgi:PKHD-type hydroxylase